MAERKDPIGELIRRTEREDAAQPRRPIDDYSGQPRTPAARPPLDDYFARPATPAANNPLSGLSDRDRARVEAMCSEKTLRVDAGISERDLGNVRNTCLTNAREDLSALGKISR